MGGALGNPSPKTTPVLGIDVFLTVNPTIASIFRDVLSPPRESNRTIRLPSISDGLLRHESNDAQRASPRGALGGGGSMTPDSEVRCMALWQKPMPQHWPSQRSVRTGFSMKWKGLNGWKETGRMLQRPPHPRLTSLVVGHGCRPAR